MRLLGDLPAGHEDVEDQENKEHCCSGGKKKGGGVPSRRGCVIMIMVMPMIGFHSRELFFGHLGAVFVMWMTMGGVEGFAKGGATFACEGEVVAAVSDDFITGEEALQDLDALVVCLAEDDGDFDIGVVEFVVFDKDEATGGIAMHSLAWNGEDVFPGRRDEMELCP